MFENYQEILTVAEVMELLNIGKNTVYELLGSGQLKGFRVGSWTWRIPRANLCKYIIGKYHQ